jgi:hypothetical protein
MQQLAEELEARGIELMYAELRDHVLRSADASLFPPERLYPTIDRAVRACGDQRG